MNAKRQPPLIPLFLAVVFLIAFLYARGAAELQPLFLFPAIILAGGTACYLWKSVTGASLLHYACHTGALGVVYALYSYRQVLMQRLPPAVWVSIGIYLCLAFFTLVLIWRLCRPLPPTRKWAAAMLAIYPAALIVVTPTVPESENRDPPVVRFSDVVEQIHIEGVSLPYEAFRCHASTRTVTAAGLTIQSVYLSVDPLSRNLNTVFLEVVEPDGQVRYAVPRSVHFDSTSFVPEGETIDGELVIISHDGNPYDWDVFYLLPSASHTPDNRRADNQGSNE